MKQMISGILDSHGWTLLVCSGVGNRSFLQGHLTCDISLLSGGDSSKSMPSLLGAACDLKGRVVASMFILDGSSSDAAASTDPVSLLLLPEDVVAPLRGLWDKYMMLYRGVTLEPYKGEFRIIVQNDNNTMTKPSIQQLPIQLPIKGAFLERGALDELSTNIATVEDKEVTDAPANWSAYLVEQGIAFVTLATTGMMTPQMLNYDTFDTDVDVGGDAVGAAVSFTKGCYLGQEVVARVHYKGKSARSCHKVHFPAAALSNKNPSPICSEVQGKKNEVGILVNHYIAQGICYGIALLSSNAVDRTNLYINDQRVELT